MTKLPKIRRLHIFAIFPEKHGIMKLIFLPADKHKGSLQVSSITLGLRSQACQYQAISSEYLQEKWETGS